MKIKKIQQSSGYVGNVIDSLENESQVDALSARQGKILKEENINTGVVISTTEPEIKYPVWLQYGKNILKTNFSAWDRGEYLIDNGQKTVNNNRVCTKDYRPVFPNETYYCHTFSTDITMVIRAYDINYQYLRNIGPIYNDKTFSTAENECYITVTLFNPSDETSIDYYGYRNYFNNGTIKPFICLNSEVDKNYEEYKYKNIYAKDSNNKYQIFSNELIIDSLRDRFYFTKMTYVENSQSVQIPLEPATPILVAAVSSGTNATPSLAFIMYDRNSGLVISKMGSIISGATWENNVLTINSLNGYWRYSYMKFNNFE